MIKKIFFTYICFFILTNISHFSLIIITEIKRKIILTNIKERYNRKNIEFYLYRNNQNIGNNMPNNIRSLTDHRSKE